MNNLSSNRNIVESVLVEHTAFAAVLNKLHQCFDSAIHSTEPMSLAVIGESRTGKTTVAETFYANHMPFRVKEGKKVPVLKVSAPSEPTIIGLAEHMLCHMGDERFYQGTKIAKTIRLKKLINAAETKMVMIDEFQHFVDKGTDRVIHSAADWLKTLVDECGVSLVFLGLESALSVLEQNEQLKGRFLAPIEMPRFDWRDKSDRQEFVAILSAFESEITTQFDCLNLSNAKMAFRFYMATGGLIGYLWKLLRQVTVNATDIGSRSLTLDDFRKAQSESIGDTGDYRPFERGGEYRATEALVSEVLGIGRHVQTKVESNRQSRRKKPVNVSQILSAS